MLPVFAAAVLSGSASIAVYALLDSIGPNVGRIVGVLRGRGA